MKPWIQTRTGGKFDLTRPRPGDVCLADIACALANLCRFTGHTTRFYSVAEHSFICAAYLVPNAYRAQALLHDASEAYVGDVAAPLKALLGDAYRDVEHRVAVAISERFGIDIVRLAPEVKRADAIALATEKRDLMLREPADWHLAHEPAAHVACIGWTPERAQLEFFGLAERLNIR